jgi:hypothetical protein
LRREKYEVLASKRAEVPYGRLGSAPAVRGYTAVSGHPNVLSIEISICHVNHNMMIVKGTTTIRSVLKSSPLCAELLSRFDRNLCAQVKSSGSVGSQRSKTSAELAKVAEAEARDANLRISSPALWSLMEQFSKLLHTPVCVRPCILLNLEIQNLLLLSDDWEVNGEEIKKDQVCIYLRTLSP